MGSRGLSVAGSSLLNMLITADSADLEWPSLISDASLRRRYGAGALARGMACRVTDLMTDEGSYVATVLEPESGHGYEVDVWGEVGSSIPFAGPTWASDCSCLLPHDCAHAVAAVLRIRQALRQGVPAGSAPRPWEKALESLLTPAPTDTPAGDLALRFTLADGYPGRFGEDSLRLEVSPARRGARGGWVKTGASWRDLSQGTLRDRLRADHVAIAEELRRVVQSTQYAPYGYVDPTRQLDLLQAPSPVWVILGRAIDAGMSLIDLNDRGVVMSPDPLTVAVTVDRRDDGDLSVRACLVSPEGDEVGRDAFLTLPLGRPMHGVALRGPAGLSLHAVPQPPPPALIPLLRTGQALTVPASDESRFTAAYLPVLRSRSRVVPGPRYRLPEVHPPRLVATVQLTDAHVTDVSWQFAYQLAGQTRRVGVDGGGLDATRDVRAEGALLESVLGLPQVAQLPGLSTGTPPRLRPQARLAGIVTATFVHTVLPRLETLDNVDVELVGEVLSYAEAVDDPVLHLDLSDRADERDWFDLAMRVTVEGQEVPLASLISALTTGEDYLLLPSGTYFALATPSLDQLRLLLQEARALIDPESATMRVSAYHAGLWEQLAALGIVQSQCARWRAAVDRLLRATEAAESTQGDPPDPATLSHLVPAGLTATLRPYQIQGLGWLACLWDAGLGGVLADDMGLGKTLQALAMLLRARSLPTPATQPPAGPVLVVAPTSVVGTWASEAARFAPDLRVAAITETERRRVGPAMEVLASDVDVVVTSYTLLRIDDEAYRGVRWGAVIFDEAQFVKNHRSKTYGAARRLERDVTLAITGTPLENSLMDLWSILSLTCPGLFPDPEAFNRDFRTPIEGGQDTQRLASLRRHIRPFVLRRTKELVAPELPVKTEQVVSVPLAPGHRRAYDRHLQRERQRLLGLLEDVSNNRVAILAGLTRLRQMALDPSLVDTASAGSGSPAKIDALVDHLRQLAAEGHRALVFSQFTRFLTKVRARLEEEGIEAVYLDGRTRDRAARIDQFRRGSATAFLISLKAGGFGLTLTEADYVFVLDPWWNPAAENQAVDRTHRIGQDKPVMVYRFVSTDTIEEKVRALQERKQGLFDRVVDDGAELATALGARDIRELLAG